MINQRDIYYISGNTTMLAKDMGKALLSRLPDNHLKEERIPFVRNAVDAAKALEKTQSQSKGRYPIIISSLFDEQQNAFFDGTELHLFTICEKLPAKIPDDTTPAHRVNAIHYTMAHDDGTGIKDYDEAELIIVGVSRSGRTPVSVFITAQHGIKTANHPRVEKDLNSCHLPAAGRRNRQKARGRSNTSRCPVKIQRKTLTGKSICPACHLQKRNYAGKSNVQQVPEVRRSIERQLNRRNCNAGSSKTEYVALILKK
ncbi:MAG: kinase/pyrophosphorylase [Desulforhopalus sp.]